MVKLPHRRSFWHPYRQKWGKEATDLASFSLALERGAKLQAFKQLFFAINVNSIWGKKGAWLGPSGAEIKERD